MDLVTLYLLTAKISLQGLPTLTAPGEAEAAAGALNAAGHVDAAGTPDGDVLLFGATEVFHTLKLLVSKPHPLLQLQAAPQLHMLLP